MHLFAYIGGYWCVVLKVEKEADLVNTDRGRILVSLMFNAKIDQLTVGINRCAGLAAMDSNGLSDPYVKMWVFADSQTVVT